VSEPQDRLNELVRSVVASAEIGDVFLSEDTMLAYLAGNASDEERQMVLRALACSSPLRQRLVDYAEELDQLSTNQAYVAFDDVSPRQVAAMRRRLGDPWLGGHDFDETSSPSPGWRWWVKTPGFAYALLLALVLAPASVWFLGRGAPEWAAGPGGSVQSILLRTEAPRFRGAEPTNSLPNIVLRPDVESVQLTVWFPQDRLIDTNRGFDIDVRLDDQTVWEESGYVGLSIVDGTPAFELAIPRDQLTPGLLHVELWAAAVGDLPAVEPFGASVRLVE